MLFTLNLLYGSSPEDSPLFHSHLNPGLLTTEFIVKEQSSSVSICAFPYRDNYYISCCFEFVVHKIKIITILFLPAYFCEEWDNEHVQSALTGPVGTRRVSYGSGLQDALLLPPALCSPAMWRRMEISHSGGSCPTSWVSWMPSGFCMLIPVTFVRKIISFGATERGTEAHFSPCGIILGSLMLI